MAQDILILSPQGRFFDQRGYSFDQPQLPSDLGIACRYGAFQTFSSLHLRGQSSLKGVGRDQFETDLSATLYLYQLKLTERKVLGLTRDEMLGIARKVTSEATQSASISTKWSNPLIELLSGRPADKISHTRSQLERIERLDHEIICSKFERANPILTLLASRQHQYRQPVQIGIGPD